MNQPSLEQEKALKVRARRRIVGAIVLAVVLTVVLPMIFEPGPARESSDVALTIPQPDRAPPFDPPLKPAPRPQSEPEAKPAAPGQGASEPGRSAPAEADPPARKSAGGAETTTKTEEATVTEKRDKPASGKFAVQLAVLSNPDNARKLQERLKANNFRFYTETLKSPPGAVRVRVGPYATHSEAEGAAARLKRAGFADGVVVSE